MRAVPAPSPSTSAAPAGLGPEAALYFRLAGARLARASAGEVATLRRLAERIDWDVLRGIARRDGTTAAVHRRLRAAGIEVPGSAAAAFAREARVLDFHRLVLEGAVHQALDLLAGAGLRVVLLKGAAVARVAYGEPTERPMSDADLLLAPEEADAAAALLRERGWLPCRADADEGAEARYAEHHHLPALRAPGGGRAVLELHHDVLPPGHPFAWGGAAMLARSRPLAGAGGARVPDCADLLLHACLHFAWSHELRQGAWRTFADLAALLDRHDATGACRIAGGAGACDGLAGLVERARAARATTAVAWTLRFAHDVAAVPLPPALAAVAREARGSPIVARHLAAELVPGAEGAPSVLLSRLLWERALRPRRSGHGRARPWLIGVAGDVATARESGGDRAVAQLRRLAAWRRYGRRLLGS